MCGLIGVGLIVIDCFTSQLNPQVDLHYFYIGNPMLYYLNGFIGSYGLILVAEAFLNNTKFISFLGRNSLIIMMTHLPLPVLMVINKAVNLLPINQYVKYGLVFVICVASECLIVFIINKYLRFLISFDSLKKIIVRGKKMGQITVEKNIGGIEGLCVITPAVHGDNRGYFMETYNENDMKENGIDITFVQDNQSMSTKGVLRGLHFQKQFPQTKLVRVIKGSVFDVAVDLRSGSRTYGKWFGVELTEQNKKQFLIPRGFAHGFVVLSDIAEFCYKCDDFYHPNDEGGLAWNDPEIGIDWGSLGIKGEYDGTASASGYILADGTPLNLSEKDQKWAGIKDTFKF